MKKLLNKRVFAVVMALAMVFAMTCVSFASNTDPNMTSQDGVFTYVATEGTAEDFMVLAGPSNSSWAFTGFDTQAGAENVTWSVVDGSTSGVSVSYTEALEIEAGKYVSMSIISVDSTAPAGSASIEVKNNATNAKVNYTVVVNPTSTAAAATGVNFEVYAPNAQTPSATGVGDVLAIDYSSDRNFPTAMDSVVRMLSEGVIDNYKASYGYLSAIEINGINYENSFYTNEGWQYRVYRNNQLVPISEVLGADDFGLQSGDKVVWKYGAYDDSDLF